MDSLSIQILTIQISARHCTKYYLFVSNFYFAHEFCIFFNVKKTKCLVLLPNMRRKMADYLQNSVVYIDNQPTEYVQSFAYLGHRLKLTSDTSDDGDIVEPCKDFNGQITSSD